MTDAELGGLSAAEVDARRADGRTNAVDEPTSRTLREILRANVLTPFNLLLVILLLAIIAVGELKDSLFGIVLVLNTLIGVIQELRAKRVLDRLALLNAPQARVRRDGGELDLPVAELVLDDLVVLRPGDQVSVDGEVLTRQRARDRRVAADRRGRSGAQVARRRGAVGCVRRRRRRRDARRRAWARTRTPPC